MIMLNGTIRIALILLFVLGIGLLMTSCSFNPFSSNNQATGSATGAVIGGAAGAGSVAAVGGTKPFLLAGGLVGGAIGYYVTTLRYDAGGLMQQGGQVYKIGDYVGIYIPTDNLFEPNSADFLPQAEPILDSAADVLQRYPDNSLMVSGNSSGFSRPKWEHRLSERRAKKVAGYLWSHGISTFKGQSINLRKLNYVGYGNYFPLSHDYTNDGIRQNSRIQITSYPSNKELELDPRQKTMNNIGAME